MGFLYKIFKTLNPLKLAGDVIGGWVGNVIKIASTVVTDIAQGKKFGDILKDVAKDVAVLSVKIAITAFTGGTAGLFINSIVDKAAGILGQVAGKVLASTLAKPVASWVAGKITGYASSLTSDYVRNQLTRIVLDVTGLKSASEQLDRASLDSAQLERRVAELFARQVTRTFSKNELDQTQFSLNTSADAFVGAA